LNKSVIAATFLSSVAIAADTQECSKDFGVLIRDKKEGYSIVSKKLDDLHCKNTFEGKYFKIVKSTSDEAISFDDKDSKLLSKAANVYYHLTIARNFWINNIKSEFVPRIPQIVIRLDITNSFSSVRHYKNEEQEKNNNNAWTIPEGSEPDFLKNPKKWGKEIWFSPMKQLQTRDLVESKGDNPIHESLLLVKDPLVNSSTSSLIYSGLSILATPSMNHSVVLETAVANLGVLAVLYGSLEVTKHMDKVFVEKYYYIETAMVPEIIYHEYAHIAMSDHLKTVHSVPVIEGMADYFAALIANRRKMYEKMDDFSTNRFKDTTNKSLYSPFLEGQWNATSDFTLSLLFKAKQEFEVINLERIKKKQSPIADFDQLVFNSHFDLDETSDIANGLTKALVKACKEKCESVRAGVNTLNKVFEDKGMN
jgi:hypothetical protein